MKAAVSLSAAMMLAACAPRHDHQIVGNLLIRTPWVRESSPTSTALDGFVTIENTGGTDDRLLDVDSPLARRVELLQTLKERGTVHLHPIRDGLLIASRQTVVLAPGGYDLTFLDLSRRPTIGERLPATLVIKHAGRVPVAFEVRGLADATLDSVARH